MDKGREAVVKSHVEVHANDTEFQVSVFSLIRVKVAGIGAAYQSPIETLGVRVDRVVH